ncbi:MAG: CDP-glycerol glycerophosphotransferase family protein [Oscillospiraceae bacterium]
MKKFQVKAFVRELFKLFAFKLVYPLTYKLCCLKKQQKDLVLFCEVRHDFLTDSYKAIYEKLKARGDIKPRVFYIHNNSGGLSYLYRYFKLCMLLPQAATILVDDTCNLFGAFKLRKGTKLIQTWHSCGAFKKWGYSIAGLSFGQDPKQLDRYPAHVNYTLVTVSSEECIPHFNEAFGFGENSCVKATGVARTDYFFDEKNQEKAFARLSEVCPLAKDKKVILYAPTYRGDADKAQPPKMFDINRLKELTGGECVLLIKQHGFVKDKTKIPHGCEDFAFDVSDRLKIEELLFVSDLCITDYSSLIFEYSLFERPMIFYAYDLDEFYDYRGFYYNYDNNFLPGDIVKTESQLFDSVKKAVKNGCDISAVRAFRERFMSACDGNSADRIIEYILN